MLPFVGAPGPALRVSTPEQPPSQPNEQANHDGRRKNGPTAQNCPQGLRGAHLNAVEVQQAPDRTGLRLSPKAGNRIASKSHLDGEPRNVEGFVDATGCLCPLGRRKRPRGEKTTPGPKAREVHDDSVSRPPNVDVLSVNGQLEISENFEGKGHVDRGRCQHLLSRGRLNYRVRHRLEMKKVEGAFRDGEPQFSVPPGGPAPSDIGARRVFRNDPKDSKASMCKGRHRRGLMTSAEAHARPRRADTEVEARWELVYDSLSFVRIFMVPSIFQ